jgi:hypothetical protein
LRPNIQPRRFGREELAPARPFSAAHPSVTALQSAAAAEPSAYVAAGATSVVPSFSARHGAGYLKIGSQIGHDCSQIRTNLIRAGSHDPYPGTNLWVRVELRGFEPLTPSMRTLAVSVNAGRFRWPADEARRARTVTGIVAAARVAAPACSCYWTGARSGGSRGSLCTVEVMWLSADGSATGPLDG